MVMAWRPLNAFALTLRVALMIGADAVISKARATEVGSSYIGVSVSPAGGEVGRSAARGHDSRLRVGPAFDGRVLEKNERSGPFVDRERVIIARRARGIEREESRFLRGKRELKPDDFGLPVWGVETDLGHAAKLS